MFITRRLEGLKENYEDNKDLAAVFGGPAVIEIFGEKDNSIKTKNFVSTFNGILILVIVFS